MKITKIQLAENKYFYQKKQNNKTNTTQTIPMQMNAYQDFRINFRGRTPENFYAQEFNVRHMPERMKEYLNQDYETRKHIPPQQIMSESFKYLEAADNFSDVKKYLSLNSAICMKQISKRQNRNFSRYQTLPRAF